MNAQNLQHLGRENDQLLSENLFEHRERERERGLTSVFPKDRDLSTVGLLTSSCPCQSTTTIRIHPKVNREGTRPTDHEREREVN